MCTNKRGLKQIIPEFGETLAFKNHQKQYQSELTGYYGKKTNKQTDKQTINGFFSKTDLECVLTPVKDSEGIRNRCSSCFSICKCERNMPYSSAQNHHTPIDSNLILVYCLKEYILANFLFYRW